MGHSVPVFAVRFAAPEQLVRKSFGARALLVHASLSGPSAAVYLQGFVQGKKAVPLQVWVPPPEVGPLEVGAAPFQVPLHRAL